MRDIVFHLHSDERRLDQRESRLGVRPCTVRAEPHQFDRKREMRGKTLPQFPDAERSTTTNKTHRSQVAKKNRE